MYHAVKRTVNTSKQGAARVCVLGGEPKSSACVTILSASLAGPVANLPFASIHDSRGLRARPEGGRGRGKKRAATILSPSLARPVANLPFASINDSRGRRARPEGDRGIPSKGEEGACHLGFQTRALHGPSRDSDSLKALQYGFEVAFWHSRAPC